MTSCALPLPCRGALADDGAHGNQDEAAGGEAGGPGFEGAEGAVAGIADGDRRSAAARHGLDRPEPPATAASAGSLSRKTSRDAAGTPCSHAVTVAPMVAGVVRPRIEEEQAALPELLR